MHGLHLTADLRGCPQLLPAMADAAALRRLCLECVVAAGLRPVGELFQAFPQPGGVTGMVLLAESHVAVHTWPEHGLATINLYCCRPRPDWPWRAQLAEILGATDVRIRVLDRGMAGELVP